MGEGDWAEDFEQLVDLIAGTEDVKAFLDGLTGFAAGMMTRVCAAHIECAVTLRRRKRTATIGGSSERALILDRIEQSLGSGPCVDALDSGVPVLLGMLIPIRAGPSIGRPLPRRESRVPWACP